MGSTRLACRNSAPRYFKILQLATEARVWWKKSHFLQYKKNRSLSYVLGQFFFQILIYYPKSKKITEGAQNNLLDLGIQLTLFFCDTLAKLNFRKNENSGKEVALKSLFTRKYSSLGYGPPQAVSLIFKKKYFYPIFLNALLKKGDGVYYID